MALAGLFGGPPPEEKEEKTPEDIEKAIREKYEEDLNLQNPFSENNLEEIEKQLKNNHPILLLQDIFGKARFDENEWEKIKEQLKSPRSSPAPLPPPPPPPLPPPPAPPKPLSVPELTRLMAMVKLSGVESKIMEHLKKQTPWEKLPAFLKTEKPDSDDIFTTTASAASATSATSSSASSASSASSSSSSSSDTPKPSRKNILVNQTKEFTPDDITEWFTLLQKYTRQKPTTKEELNKLMNNLAELKLKPKQKQNLFKDMGIKRGMFPPNELDKGSKNWEMVIESLSGGGDRWFW